MLFEIEKSATRVAQSEILCPLHHCPIRRLCAAATGAKTHLYTPRATVAAYVSLWHTAEDLICTNQRQAITFLTITRL